MAKNEAVQATLRERFGVTEMEARFLWLRHQYVRKGARKRGNHEFWIQAGSKSEPEAAAVTISRVLRKANIQEASAWLTRQREKKEKRPRREWLRRVKQHATADPGDYYAISELSPRREELTELLASKLPDEQVFKELRRRLFSIQLKDWSKLTKLQRLSIQSVEETPDGRIKFKLEPKAWPEKMLQEAYGWSQKDAIWEKVLEELKRIVAAVGADDPKLGTLMAEAFAKLAEEEEV
jgi:hypothetical protein